MLLHQAPDFFHSQGPFQASPQVHTSRQLTRHLFPTSIRSTPFTVPGDTSFVTRSSASDIAFIESACVETVFAEIGFLEIAFLYGESAEKFMVRLQDHVKG